MGDYKMSQVEAVERDRSRAVDEAAYWISRSKHERAVAAAVEERDRRIEELETRIRAEAEAQQERADRYHDRRKRITAQEWADWLRSLLSPDGKENPGLPDGGSVQ